MAEEINNQEVQPEFHIQRVYTKDVSFEAPNTPHIFQKEWQPDVKLDMDTKTNILADSVYEVVLTLTVTCKLETETAFLCEVQQAGIFTIGNLPEPQLAHCLAAFCPNILFPYAREARPASSPSATCRSRNWPTAWRPSARTSCSRTPAKRCPTW